MTGPNIIRIPTELLPDNAISGGIIMSIEGSSNLSDFLSSLQILIQVSQIVVIKINQGRVKQEKLEKHQNQK